MKRQSVVMMMLVYCLGLTLTAKASVVAYYNFEGANPYDDKISGTTGIAGAGVTIDGDSPLGDTLGSSGLFPASGDCVTVAQSDAPAMGVNDFSIMFWMKRVTGTSSPDGIFDGMGATNTGSYQFNLGINAFQDRPVFGVRGPGTTFQAYPTIGQIQDAAWRHIALTVDRDDTAGLKLYIDGALDNTFDPTAWAAVSIQANQDLRIGRFNNTHGLNGSLDDLAFFNEALSASDIAGIANGTISIPEPMTISILTFGGLTLLRRRNLLRV